MLGAMRNILGSNYFSLSSEIKHRLTMSLIAKPFAHFTSTPEETEVCLMGNENVKPSALVPGDG